jgi:hypothetical protein
MNNASREEFQILIRFRAECDAQNAVTTLEQAFLT